MTSRADPLSNWEGRCRPLNYLTFENVGMTLLFAILTKNASFRSYGTFAYLLRAHIRNINMRMYITSARGHELSGRVRAHAYNYMPGHTLQISF